MSDSAASLFQPFHLGPTPLPSRIVMAPLTRNRADENLAPHTLNAEYYRQRATAGLIVSEATQISPAGIGYPGTPGIHSDAQKKGWSLVTEAVHAAGGRIFAQLWFCGRVAHPDLLGGEAPVSASALKPKEGQAATPTGMKDFVEPRPLTVGEIDGIVEDYAAATRLAEEAGFDGVEVHAANGYLLDQFLRSGSNQRTDDYGGSAENRARFAVRVAEACAAVRGADRVGIRISPTGTFGDMRDENPAETFGHLAREMKRVGLAYIHVNEPSRGDFRHGADAFETRSLRPHFDNALVACGDYDRERAIKVLDAGDVDLVAFGRLYIANPDLPERLRRGGPYNQPDPSSFYGGDETGYTDYPTLAD